VLNRLRKLFGNTTEGHSLHAPFHVTTHHGHIVQTFLSLETALEVANSWVQIITLSTGTACKSGTRKEDCCVMRNGFFEGGARPALGLALDDARRGAADRGQHHQPAPTIRSAAKTGVGFTG
jgi:hypothetical protein